MIHKINRLSLAFTLALTLSLLLTTIGLAKVWTDQSDYAPGSDVTISGDNTDGAGYLAGETVQVEVSGPNGYEASCQAEANEDGAWSCQVTLWDSTLAAGYYSYTATGQSSGVSQSGSFTVSAVRIRFATAGLPVGTSVTVNWTRYVPSCNDTTGTGTTTFTASGPSAQTQACELAGQNTFVYSFPSTIVSGGVTYALQSSTPSSGSVFTTDTIITATYALACTAPSISTQPSGATKTVGDSVTFSVAANGTAPLSYQWRKDGSNVGSNSNSIEIDPVWMSDAGSYDVVVSNSCGSATSNAAMLTVNKANATINVSGYTGTYDGDPHGATGTATGVGGVDLSSSLELGATFTDVPGGTAHWTFDGGDNYNDASGDVDIVISKADASCSITGYTGVYDGDPHGATGTCMGVKDETLDGLDLGASFTDVPGGTANWTFTDVTGNYNDDSGSVEIVINKADPTCTVTGYTGVYDGNPHGASGTCTGVKGETLSGLDLGASFTNVPGGTAH